MNGSDKRRCHAHQLFMMKNMLTDLTMDSNSIRTTLSAFWIPVQSNLIMHSNLSPSKFVCLHRTCPSPSDSNPSSSFQSINPCNPSSLVLKPWLRLRLRTTRTNWRGSSTGTCLGLLWGSLWARRSDGQSLHSAL